MAQGRKAKSLAGRRIVITRRAEQAHSLHRALSARGAEVIELPTIALAPPRSWRPVDAAIRRLEAYDWVIFTSVNGVEEGPQENAAALAEALAERLLNQGARQILASIAEAGTRPPGAA